MLQISCRLQSVFFSDKMVFIFIMQTPFQVLETAKVHSGWIIHMAVRLRTMGDLDVFYAQNVISMRSAEHAERTVEI
jgi:hypothetical protein